MLPKPFFIAAKKKTIDIANKYKGETDGKTGLSAVPIEIGRQIKDHLHHLARELKTKIPNDLQLDVFLEDMGKAGIIAKHPWGGWMAPQQQQTIPSIDEAKPLILKLYHDLKGNK